jgi:hypothetical protein
MAGIYPSNVITHEHLHKINDAVKKVNDAMNEAKLAIDAGITNPAKLAELQAMKDRLLKVKTVYFPGQ